MTPIQMLATRTMLEDIVAATDKADRNKRACGWLDALAFGTHDDAELGAAARVIADALHKWEPKS